MSYTDISKKPSTQKSSPSNFTVVESYKMIRTNLLFLLSQADKKSFTVSSANEAEGKSTTSINVAIAFSQLGCRVLLIDTDMRRSSVHKKLRISNEKGLSSLLVGFTTLEETVHKVNDNLDVITAGAIPPNPSELLASQRMKDLLEKLHTVYDYIIVDAPPVNVVSDALVVAPQTGGIVFVVRDHITQHSQIAKAIKNIKFTGAHTLGLVLNDARNAHKKPSRYEYHNENANYNYTYNYSYKRSSKD